MNKSNRRTNYVRQDAANETGENTNQIRGVTPGRRMSSDPERVKEIAQRMIDDGDLPGWAVFESKLQCCPSDVLVYDTIEDMQSGTYYEWGNDVAEASVNTFENPNPITYFPQAGQMCIVPGPRGGIFRFVEEDSTDPDAHPVEDGGIVFGAGTLAEIEGDIKLYLYAPMEDSSERGYWTSSLVRHYGTIGNNDGSTHYRNFPQEINWEIKDADGNILNTSQDFVNNATNNNNAQLIAEVPEGTYTLVMQNTSDGISLPVDGYDDGGAEYFPNGMGWAEFNWNLFLDTNSPQKVYPHNQATVCARTPPNYEPQFIDDRTGKRYNPLFSPGEGTEQEHTFEVKHKARRTGHNYYNAYWIREGTEQAKEWESKWWYDPDAEDDADHINQMFNSAIYKKQYEGGKEPSFVISPGDYTTLSPIRMPHGMRNWGRIQIHAWGAHINVRHWAAGISSKPLLSEVNQSQKSQWELLHNWSPSCAFDIQGFTISGLAGSTPEGSTYSSQTYYEPLLTMSQYNLFEDWYNPNEEIETLYGATETDDEGNLIPLIATNDGYTVGETHAALVSVATHYSSVMIEIGGGYAGGIQNNSVSRGAVGIRTVLGLGWLIQNNLTAGNGFSNIEPQQGNRILVEPFPWISVGESGYQEFTEPVTSDALRELRDTDADPNAPEYPLDTGDKFGETGRLWASDVEEEDPAYKLYEVRTDVTIDAREVVPKEIDETTGTTLSEEVQEEFEETIPAIQYIRSNLKNRENRQDSGCTDHIACNYDPTAAWDGAVSHSNGTCIYPFAEDVVPLNGCYDCAGNMLWRRIGVGMSYSNSQSNVATIKDNRGYNTDGCFTYIFSQSNGLLLNQNISEGARTYYGVWHTGGSNVRGIRSYSLWVEEPSGPSIRGRLYAENNYHYYQRANNTDQHVPPTDPLYGQYRYPNGGLVSGDGWVYKVRGTDPISIEEIYHQYAPRIIHSTSSNIAIRRISWLANGQPPYFGYKRPTHIQQNTFANRTVLSLASLNSAQQSFAPGNWPFYGLTGGDNTVEYLGGKIEFFSDINIVGKRNATFRIGEGDQVNWTVLQNAHEENPKQRNVFNWELHYDEIDTSSYGYEGLYGDNNAITVKRIEHFVPWQSSSLSLHNYWPDQKGVHAYSGAWTGYGFENDGLVWANTHSGLTWTIGNATILGVRSVMGHGYYQGNIYAGYNIYSSAACQGTFKIMGGFTGTIPGGWQQYHGGEATYDARQSAEIWMYENKTNGNNYIKLKAQEDLASNFTITVPGITGTMMMNVVEDTTPQLGGPLDVNGQIITTASNGDVTIDPDGTGSIILKSDDIQFQTANVEVAGGDLRLYESSLLTPQHFIAIQAPASVTADTTLTLPDGAGSNKQVLSTNGSGTLSWITAMTSPNPTATGVLKLKSANGINEAALQIFDLDESNSVNITVPSNLTSDVTFQLPAGNGISGQVLATNGSGVLSYINQTADTNTNLGNGDLTLSAERTIEMGNNSILFENSGTQVAKIWAAGYLQGTGRVIVKGTSVIGGTLRLRDADNTHQIDLVAPTTLSSSLSFTLPSADGSSGQFLKTNGSGTLSFDSASGGADGWHGSTTRIKILPRDFIPSDQGRPAMIDDSGVGLEQLFLESHSSNLLYVSIPIPTGFKATHVKINGSATDAVECWEFQIDSKTGVSKGTGNVGTEINITDVTSSTTNYLLLQVANASGNEIHGGYVTIAAV